MRGNFSNPSLVLTSGTYTGNSSANRAIPHGLGRIPKLINIYDVGNDKVYHIFYGASKVMQIKDSSAYSVTAVDSVNFYVGNAGSYAASGNNTAVVYNWVAI